VVTKEQKEILEKAIKFRLNPKKVPIEEITSKIKTGFHKFSIDVNNLEDLRLWVVSILNFFYNFQENLKIRDIKVLKDLKKMK